MPGRAPGTSTPRATCPLPSGRPPGLQESYSLEQGLWWGGRSVCPGRPAVPHRGHRAPGPCFSGTRDPSWTCSRWGCLLPVRPFCRRAPCGAGCPSLPDLLPLRPLRPGLVTLPCSPPPGRARTLPPRPIRMSVPLWIQVREEGTSEWLGEEACP